VEEKCFRNGTFIARDRGDDQGVDVCWESARQCSYRDDREVGFVGRPSDGALTLSIDGTELVQCLVLIHEETAGWVKTWDFVDWRHELRVTVNGTRCEAPDCSFGDGSVWVNARGVLGSKCRRGHIEIALEVAPLAAEQLSAAPGLCQRQGESCELGPQWSGKYPLGVLERLDDEKSLPLCIPDGAGCTASTKAAQLRAELDLKTIVSIVVAF